MDASGVAADESGPTAAEDAAAVVASPAATAAEAKTTVDDSDDDPRRDLDADRAAGKGGATADAEATIEVPSLRQTEEMGGGYC